MWADADAVAIGWHNWRSSTGKRPLRYLQDVLEDQESRFYTRVMEVGSFGWSYDDMKTKC